MELNCSATNGERCRGERHQFRIGIDAGEVTEFSATEGEFFEALKNALIDHGIAKRAGWNHPNLYLQVLTDGRNDWRNCQNRETGGVIAVNPSIVDSSETAEHLFLWCCDSVQMMRDCRTLADGIAREAIE